MLGNKVVQRKSETVEEVAEALVSRLYDDIRQEACAVFVGAGCTTERGSTNRDSFYEEIKAKSGYSSKAAGPPFTDLMEYFCSQFDGGQHNRLIREAVSRIERFSVPGEDHHVATMFGDELAEIPYFNRFVTTNWDPFLERSLEILIPIVEDRDLAFWDDRKRQVLKIHGCITRPYSIVATKTDYATCVERNPLIFNKLRDLMATKTFLFLGYSLRDADFQQVWDEITRSLGPFAKLAYAVDPLASEEKMSEWLKRGIQLFKTSDLMFIRSLRGRLERDKLIPSDKFLRFLRRQRRRIASIHIRLSQHSSGGFASAMYQDGLLDGLDDALTSSALGTKKRGAFERDLAEARGILTEMWEKDDIVEIAYWSGRREAIERFCAMKAGPIPAYFHPGRLRPLAKLVRGDKFTTRPPGSVR